MGSMVPVYSQYIDVVLYDSSCLEELGCTSRSTRSLFAEAPAEPIDEFFKPKSEVDSSPTRYVMILETRPCPRQPQPQDLTDKENVTTKVRVVMISQARSEGLDFSFHRQVHVLNPWYNMNQGLIPIIERAVRTVATNSCHSQSVMSKYSCGSILPDNNIVPDLYVCKLAELTLQKTCSAERELVTVFEQ